MSVWKLKNSRNPKVYLHLVPPFKVVFKMKWFLFLFFWWYSRLSSGPHELYHFEPCPQSLQYFNFFILVGLGFERRFFFSPLQYFINCFRGKKLKHTCQMVTFVRSQWWMHSISYIILQYLTICCNYFMKNLNI
jgi:hypothetical protein